MSVHDRQPTRRFPDGEPFPNADKLYSDFLKRPDYQDRLFKILKYLLFIEKNTKLILRT